MRTVTFTFIGGFTKDYSQGTASQIALRNCSKEVGQYIWLGEGIQAFKHTSQKVAASHEEQIFSVHGFHDFLIIGRCKNLDSEVFLLEIYTFLRACSASFLRAQNALLLISALNYSHSVPIGQQLQWLMTQFLQNQVVSDISQVAGIALLPI